MNTNQITPQEAISSDRDWSKLKSQVRPLSPVKLGSYDIVFVVVGEGQSPMLTRAHETEVACALAFSTEAKGREFLKGSEGSLLPMTVVYLCEELQNDSKVSYIKVDPRLEEGQLFCDNVLFSPLFDSFTQKSLMTNPGDAKALLALNAKDEKRFGMELTFYVVTNHQLAESGELRQKQLKEKIEELAFTAPRIPMRKGSGCFLIVIINLENEFEENAFIRDYQMFDEHSNVLFVTSSLRFLDGHFNEIHYNGEQIDTIFGPMVNWQKNLK